MIFNFSLILEKYLQRILFLIKLILFATLYRLELSLLWSKIIGGKSNNIKNKMADEIKLKTMKIMVSVTSSPTADFSFYFPFPNLFFCLTATIRDLLLQTI